MRWLLALALVGCADPTGLGEASSTGLETAASATVIVTNVPDGIGGSFRVWSIEIGDAAPGTDCRNRGDALVVFDVYTRLNSAPRGTIPVQSLAPPPDVLPALYPYFPDGVATDGEMTINAASSTRILGSFHGHATLMGSTVTLDLTFDAPTCGV